MNSPFPGMDPYIEASGLWGDFHSNLIQEIKSALAEAIPERYLVRSKRRTYLVLADEAGKRERLPLHKRTLTTPADPEAEVVSMQAFVVEEFRESFIEIYEGDEQQQLVTVIEVLSPSNKRPGTKGWDLYFRKRQSLLLGGANFVEIDLLRGGRKMPMLDTWPQCPYTLLVGRRWKAPYCRVRKAWSLKPLPAIPVPLLRPDADVQLELQPLVDAIYTRNRYHRSIDYTKATQPPLSHEEATHLGEQLRARTPSA